MIFTTDSLQKVKLVMWERTMMPESEMKEVSGKKSFVKTGKEIEMTTYTFKDSAGDKLELTSKENNYRTLEGEIVDITLDVKLNNFTKKLQTRLARVEKSQPQL